MKKYITTDEHPILKQGLIINKNIINSESIIMTITDLDRNFQLNQGYIKELQEPKWTDDDMIEFAERLCFDVEYIREELDNFKQSKS